MRIPVVAALVMAVGIVNGQPVQVQVEASAYAGQQATLYRYLDAFTQRLEPLAKARVNDDGHVDLAAEVEGTVKAQLRIGDVTANLWLRPGILHVQLPALAEGQVRSIGGTTRVDLLFTELDPLDINALMADLNTRLDEFTALRAMGEADSTQAGQVNADTFALKLGRFYAEVHDPWFQENVAYGLANLKIGHAGTDRILFNAFLKGKPVLYDVPEYTRFINTFFKDHVLRSPFRKNTQALLQALEDGRPDSLKALLARNDFLRDDRLNELVLITNLYYNHADARLSKDGILEVLKDVRDHSAYAEHRMIAGNMLWDLSAMKPGTPLPDAVLRNAAGEEVRSDDLMEGDVCLMLARTGNTFSEKELLALSGFYAEYGPYVRFIHVLIGGSANALADGSRSKGKTTGEWLVPDDERALLDTWRIGQVPVVLLLRNGVIEAAPAPLPSDGLAAELHRIKARKLQGLEERHRQGAKPAKHRAP